MTSAGGWTVPEALEKFAEAGMPLDETGFRAVVRAAQRLGTLQRVGEPRALAGRQGGRPRVRYEIGALQQMHKDLARWIPAREGKP